MPQYDVQYPDTRENTIARNFDRDEGIMAIPVAGSVDGNEEMAIVHLSSPYEFTDIPFHIICDGAAPDYPDPLTFYTVSNVVFLGRKITSIIPMNTATERGYAYQISGLYRYALKKPRPVNAVIPTGKIFFENTSITAFDIPIDRSNANILSPTSLNP